MIDFARLQRTPDLESPGLEAFDAADRLLLDVSAGERRDMRDVVAIGDTHGALSVGAASEGATVRAHQDSVLGARAISRNADTAGLGDRIRVLPLDRDLVAGARLILMRLPRSLEQLDDLAALVAREASPDVVVYAGGRIKHMAVSMNEVLRHHFGALDVLPARQKSRVLRVTGPIPGDAPVPRTARVVLPGGASVTLQAWGGVFAGARLDDGTRLLLEHLPDPLPTSNRERPLIDLASGSGLIATTLALRGATVFASDASELAVRSTQATATAAGVADRVTVARGDGLELRPGASADLIALNPPFHAHAATTDRIAEHLFRESRRVLAPGGELWCVWNSPQRYRSRLEQIVGPTHQVARDPRFTVTVSRRPSRA